MRHVQVRSPRRVRWLRWRERVFGSETFRSPIASCRDEWWENVVHLSFEKCEKVESSSPASREIYEKGFSWCFPCFRERVQALSCFFLHQLPFMASEKRIKKGEERRSRSFAAQLCPAPPPTGGCTRAPCIRHFASSAFCLCFVCLT